MDGKDTITDFYVKPYNRCQPYLIGILVGYVLFKMKDKKIRIPWVRALYVLLTFEYTFEGFLLTSKRKLPFV